MNSLRAKHFYLLVGFCLGFSLLSSCASFFEDYDESLLVNKEYEKKLIIEETASEEESISPSIIPKENRTKKANSKKEKRKSPKITAKKTSVKKVKRSAKKAPVQTNTPQKKTATGPRLPLIEDTEGFQGRRPLIEPLRVGEKTVYSVSYFAVEAGRFTIEVKPFKKVNGKKSWHFHYSGKTSSVFSLFYALDDKADAYWDYDQLIPYSYSIDVKESKQVRTVRALFDWEKKKGFTWDKKLKKGEKLKIKNYEWELKDFSQSVFTVAFYLRHFQLKVGKKLSIPVAHEGKNLVMKAVVDREETIRTSVGKFKAVVIKPTFEIDGIFKQVGDISIWLSSDERKRILRIESKIKIGTIVAAVEEIEP